MHARQHGPDGPRAVKGLPAASAAARMAASTITAFATIDDARRMRLSLTSGCIGRSYRAGAARKGGTVL